MPGQHPDDDLLADLAADVLPLDQARAVEAHVLGCDRCASLLSDAERVRGLLLADDAGPVPPEIWNRIEAALQAPSPASHTGRDERAPAPPPPPAAPLTRRVDAGGPGGWDGPDPLDNPDDWATAIRPAVTSDSHPRPTLGAGVRGTSTSRRDSRPERRLRAAPLLLSAAAAVVLLLAVGAVRLVQSGGGPTAAFGNSASSDAGGGASAAAPSGTGAVITRSGRDYTSSTLAAAAASLVHASAQPKGQSAGGAVTRSLSSSPEPRAAAVPDVAPDPKATDVTNPQRLAACLSALGAASDSVVAVDLARYQGREAAVLVVRTANGYEVWVVERTCHPGDEGALAERTLPG